MGESPSSETSRGEPPAAESPIATPGKSPVERAEHLVDRFGQQLNSAREQRAARAAAAQATQNGQPQRPPMERAEETIDRAGQQVGVFTARAGHELRRFFARAREEAEDIWAEAQNMSHQRTPPPGPPPEEAPDREVNPS